MAKHEANKQFTTRNTAAMRILENPENSKKRMSSSQPSQVGGP